MYLRTDAQFKILPEGSFMQARAHQESHNPVKGQQEQEGTEQVGKKRDSLNEGVIFPRYHYYLIRRTPVPQFLIPFFFTMLYSSLRDCLLSEVGKA